MIAADLLNDDVLHNPVLWADIYPIDPGDVAVLEMPRWMAATLKPDFTAITLSRWVWIREEALTSLEGDDLRRLLIHELVHVRQWRELGILRFLARYLSDYALGRIGGKTHRAAYRGISLEVEARARAESII